MKFITCVSNKYSFSFLPFFSPEYDKNFRQDLHVGEHTHNFTFKLKEDLPTSYESKHAYVRYFLCAQFFRPEWKKTDYKFKEPFTVVSIIDLNSEPNVLVRLTHLLFNSGDGSSFFNFHFPKAEGRGPTFCL